MREVFQQELAEVQDRLVEIAELVVRSIENATAAFTESDVSLAEDVIANDHKIDELTVLLDELSIKHLRKSKAYALSGGERRRLEITRALVTNPKFMLLDEPFAGVDPIAVHDIQTIVAGLRHRGIGVLITDHNVEQTLDIVDRAYIMFEGKVQVYDRMQDTNPYVFYGDYMDGCLTRISTQALLNVTAGGGSTVPTFLVEQRD